MIKNTKGQALDMLERWQKEDEHFRRFEVVSVRSYRELGTKWTGGYRVKLSSRRGNSSRGQIWYPRPSLLQAVMRALHGWEKGE